MAARGARVQLPLRRPRDPGGAPVVGVTWPTRWPRQRQATWRASPSSEHPEPRSRWCSPRANTRTPATAVRRSTGAFGGGVGRAGVPRRHGARREAADERRSHPRGHGSRVGRGRGAVGGLRGGRRGVLRRHAPARRHRPGRGPKQPPAADRHTSVTSACPAGHPSPPPALERIAGCRTCQRQTVAIPSQPRSPRLRSVHRPPLYNRLR